MISDHLQRKKALETTKSYIMQAPAGSGKTEILIQRFLALLATVTRPEEILALTFTRKAAAEMRARVLNALSIKADTITSTHQETTFALAQKVITRSNKLNWDLSLNPARLQISTIDSFATGLVNQMPILSQLGSKSTILDNPYKEYQQATQNTIKFLESDTKWSDALFNLTSYFDNQFIVMEELFVNMLGKREQWLPYIGETNKSAEIKRNFDQCLQEINLSYTKNIYNLLSSSDKNELVELGKFASQFLKTDHNINLTELEDTPTIQQNNILVWKFYSSMILTKNITVRKKITIKEGFPSQATANNSAEQQLFKVMKERMLNFLTKIADNEQMLAILKDIALSPPNIFAENQWQITENIFHVLRLLVANLMIIFKERNAIDFCELNLRSMNTLEVDGIPTDLSLLLDYKIKHILIDEFQDTSNHHFRLIKKLTAEWQPNEDKTIFIVGDPMQSIYRFREAEVGLFLQVKDQGINNIKLSSLILESNFRSNHPIVNFCNTVFSASFPSTNNISKGAIAFKPSKATQNISADSNVSIHLCSSEQHEAQLTINLIKKNIKKYPDKKIAVLARTRKNLKILIDQLQQTNIKFIAHEIDNIYDKSITHDLLAITRAIYDITDKLAWLALLRAPWCGLELSDLLKISKQARSSNIYQVITGELANISEFGANRLKKLRPAFIYMTERSGRTSLSKLVAEVWQMLGGPNTLRSSKDLQWVKQYLDLLENNQQNNTIFNLYDFEYQLINTRVTPDSKVEPNVELMTIHKSKGLEYDMVFLLGITNIIPNPQRNILEWSELQFTNRTSLLLAPIKGIGHDQNPIYEHLYRASKEKDDYEKIRLMYVAATRTKFKLMILINIKENIDINDYKVSKASFIYPFWNSFMANATVINNLQNNNIETEYISEVLYRVKNIKEISEQHTLNPLEQSNKNLAQYDIANQITNTNIGTITHDILRTIVKYDLLEHLKFNKLISRDNLAKRLIKSGVPKYALLKSTNTIINSIKNTATDLKGKWILNPHHQNSECELPITSIFNKKILNIIIDRTFIENNIRWIIDYKISCNEQALLPNLLDIKKQYGKQLNTYAKIISLQEDRPIMLGVYMPIQQAWFEWEYNMADYPLTA